MDKLNPWFTENNNYLHYMKKEEVSMPPSINYKVFFEFFMRENL